MMFGQRSWKKCNPFPIDHKKPYTIVAANSVSAIRPIASPVEIAPNCSALLSMLSSITNLLRTYLVNQNQRQRQVSYAMHGLKLHLFRSFHAEHVQSIPERVRNRFTECNLVRGTHIFRICNLLFCVKGVEQ